MHSMRTGAAAVTVPEVNSSIISKCDKVVPAIRILFDTCLGILDEKARFLAFLSDITLYFRQG